LLAYLRGLGWQINFCWIPREQNEECDALSKKSGHVTAEVSESQVGNLNFKSSRISTEIMTLVAKHHGVSLDRESIVSALAKRIARKDRFARTGPSTFSIRPDAER